MVYDPLVVGRFRAYLLRHSLDGADDATTLHRLDDRLCAFVLDRVGLLLSGGAA
jgi:hypothetical protein